MAVVIACSGSWSDATAAKPRKRSGTVAVKAAGLPPGHRATVVFSRAGLRPVTARSGRIVRLRAGRWTMKVRPVTVRRTFRSVRRGARVYPAGSAVRLTVRAGRRRSVTARYGSVVNPRVAQPPAPTQVVGPPGDPTAIVVSARSKLRSGDFVSAAPTAALPAGLMAQVTAARTVPGGRELSLRPAAVEELVPVIDFRGRLPQTTQARGVPFGGAFEYTMPNGCGTGGSASVTPFGNLPIPELEAHFRGPGWRNAPELSVALKSRPTFGYRIDAEAGFFCEAEIAAPTAYIGAIPVGPVPVPIYLSLPLSLRAQIGAKTVGESSITWDQKIGFRTRSAGFALVPTLIFEATNPQSASTIRTTPAFTIGPQVGFEFGLGVRRVITLRLEAKTAVEFNLNSGPPRECSWDWRMGNVNIGGEIGPFKLTTPEIAKGSHRLWTGCGGSTFDVPEGRQGRLLLAAESRLQSVPADRPAAPPTAHGQHAGEVVGLDSDGTHVFTMEWVRSTTQEIGTDATIYRAALDGSGRTALATFPAPRDGGTPYEAVVANGYVHWYDSDGIGRIRTDGTDRQDSFIPVPRTTFAGDEQGTLSSLDTDGTWLYFSSCFGDSVGRVRLDGTALETDWIYQDACTQTVAANDTHLFWEAAERPSSGSDVHYLARAKLDGSEIDRTWVLLENQGLGELGVYKITADQGSVYLNSGDSNAGGGKEYMGRVSTGSGTLEPKVLTFQRLDQVTAIP